MRILIGILCWLGFVVAHVVHRGSTDSDGVPIIGMEGRAAVSELLMAAALAFLSYWWLGAPAWGAIGIAVLGLLIHDVHVDLHRSLRKSRPTGSS